MSDMARDYDEFRKWNRDLSDRDCRERYCQNRDVDPHDLDAATYEESQRRRAYYRAMDGY